MAEDDEEEDDDEEEEEEDVGTVIEEEEEPLKPSIKEEDDDDKETDVALDFFLFSSCSCADNAAAVFITVDALSDARLAWLLISLRLSACENRSDQIRSDR